MTTWSIISRMLNRCPAMFVEEKFHICNPVMALLPHLAHGCNWVIGGLCQCVFASVDVRAHVLYVGESVCRCWLSCRKYCQSCFSVRFTPLTPRGSLLVLKWHCGASVLDVPREGTMKTKAKVMAAASQSTVLKSCDTLNVQVVSLCLYIDVHVDAVLCKQRGHAWHHCVHQLKAGSHTQPPPWPGSNRVDSQLAWSAYQFKLDSSVWNHGLENRRGFIKKGVHDRFIKTVRNIN